MTFALDERALRNAPAPALGVLTRLRVKGFGVSLDSFGAGHARRPSSSAALPLTEVRLAPVLVTGAGGGPAADPGRSRTRSTSAATLDVTIVGDGCESEDDLRLLLELGCDRVHGRVHRRGDARRASCPAGWRAGTRTGSCVGGDR